MATDQDPIDKYIPALKALLRTVYDDGGDARVKRLLALAAQPAVESAPARVRINDPVLPGLATAERKAGPGGPRQYEYGLVKKTVRNVLRQNPQGLTRPQVHQATHTIEHQNIDEVAVKNALKAMVKAKEAESRDGLYFLKA